MGEQYFNSEINEYKKMEEKTAGKLIFKIGKYVSMASRAMGVKGVDRKLFSEVIETFGGRLRLIVTGAAAIDPRVAEDFMHMGIDLYIGYGLQGIFLIFHGDRAVIQTFTKRCRIVCG